MKKKITAIILAVVMLLSTVGVFAASAADIVLTQDRTDAESAKLATMVKKLDNGKMELYIDESTAEVAIRNKKTGEIWLSNPYNGTEKFLSQILIDYKQSGSTAPPTNMNTYTNSIAFETPSVEYKYTADSVKVTYTIAESEPFDFIPERMTVDTFNRVVAEMRASQAVEDMINSKPLDGLSIDKSFVGRYDLRTDKEGNQYYELRRLNPLHKRNAERFLKVIGFTEADVAAEYEALNYTSEASKIASFTIPLEYKLTDTGFSAEVDASKISFDRENFVLSAVYILPYFNAATQYEQGYNFIPDGSGALVRYEDVTSRGSMNSVNVKLYGKDSALYAQDTKIEEQATMPVFGQVLNELPYNSGFFAIIENSSAVATVSSIHDTYHSVCAAFEISPSDKTKITTNKAGDLKDFGLIADTIFTDKCTVSYSMLTDKAVQESKSVTGYDTSYVEMAKMYRDILVSKGTFEKITNDEASKGTKIFLEVFGSMKVEEKIATFPVTVNKALTTFDQVMLIQEELSTAGVGPMNFILTGFANEGLSSKYPTKIKWLGSVGGKSGFEKLLLDAKEKGYEVSPNFDFAYSTYLFGKDNIKYKKYGGKSLDERFSVKLLYDPALQSNMLVGGIVISSGSYEYAYEKFAKSATKYDIANLAVSTLGSDLNSDFNPKNFIYRTESMDNTVNLLAKLNGKVESSTAYKLLVEKGNAYAYDYISYITKSALDSSRRMDESEAVPFLGMVLHGNIVFSGTAINMEGDADYTFLKVLENGANLYFTVAYENVEYLKLNQNFNKYYSVSYDLWKDYIIAKYDEYNKVMGSKVNSYIVDHEFLNTSESDGTFVVQRHDTKGAIENSSVVRVEYENGEGFFLNYNSEFAVEIAYNGLIYIVQPLSYKPYTASNN